MRKMSQAGRPRRTLGKPVHQLTIRVRQLIDLAHGGNVRNASRLTSIPYPTLNDLYIGKTVNPNLATLESLSAPYDIELSWLLAVEDPGTMPRTGRSVLLPPGSSAEVRQRALRKVQIPFVAWSMYEVFTAVEARLIEMPATTMRPIVAEAEGDTLQFRLATFLFQPLLAAEKAGESNLIPADTNAEEQENPRAAERWIVTLRALGDVWKAALPGLFHGIVDSAASE